MMTLRPFCCVGVGLAAWVQMQGGAARNRGGQGQPGCDGGAGAVAAVGTAGCDADTAPGRAALRGHVPGLA